jgi:hypothetical protein
LAVADQASAAGEVRLSAPADRVSVPVSVQVVPGRRSGAACGCPGGSRREQQGRADSGDHQQTGRQQAGETLPWYKHHMSHHYLS